MNTSLLRWLSCVFALLCATTIGAEARQTAVTVADNPPPVIVAASPVTVVASNDTATHVARGASSDGAPDNPPSAGAATDAPDNPAHAASSHDASDSSDKDEDEFDEPERGDRGHRFDWRNPMGRHSHHGWHYRDGNNVVSIGHDSKLASGQQANSVVSILGSSTSDGNAVDVVSILGNTRVTGPVEDNAVAVLGNTYIDSKIDGDVVAVLGNVELGPHAEVGGNVVAVLGTLNRDPAAIVHGGVENIIAGSIGDTTWLHSWIQHCLLYGRPLALVAGIGWAWTLALVFLALYICLALLFRSGVARCVQTVETRPGHTALAALLTMLLTPVLVVLLCVTVIGIAAVPFVVVSLFCAALFGKAVMLAWIGRRIVGDRPGPVGHPAFSVLIGGAVVLVLYLVPVLGFLVYKLLGIFGLGAVAYTLILNVRTRQEATSSRLQTPGPTATAAPTSHTTPAAATTPFVSVTPTGSVTAAGSVAAAIGAEAMGGTTQAGAGASRGAAPIGSETPASGSAPGSNAAPNTAVPPQAGAERPLISAAMPRAGFWIRIAALFLDVLLIGFGLSLLHPMGHVHLVVLAVYGAVMWKLRGATVGGIVFDLHVVRLDGRAVDWETAIVRALGCFLSLAVVGLGFIWIAFDEANQAWHDKIAGTVVVRAPKATPM
jgi:uncharacterized RDD family membrane protein YckC